MKKGDLIAINGNLYEYGGLENAEYSGELKLHKVYEVDIDEDGILTATYNPWYFANEEIVRRNIQLTEKQWIGLISYFLRNEYGLSDEKVLDAANDIVYRCFAITGIPDVEELNKYISDYLKR